MKISRSGITAPIGFKANGINCGIKKKNFDLGLIFSQTPAKASVFFTSNKIQAAPIKVSKEHLKKTKFIQAIIANSGNANCFTDSIGMKYASYASELVAKKLGIEKEKVLVASTGVIGKPLPVEKIKKGIPVLVKGLGKDKSYEASCAIMTTDTFAKDIAVEFKIGKKLVKIGAMAKGVGMIYPQLKKHATMLCFITTDANISQKALDLALAGAVEKNFNCISVDGCTSTNDMVAILANGLSQNKTINIGTKDFKEFSKALDFVCFDLAKKLILDAEGATKFIKINVIGAKSDSDAKKVAFTIANSVLFKTACFGQNPNWGRIVAAIGASGADVKEEDIEIKFSSFKAKDIDIVVNLKSGKGEKTVYTSDLSYEYVKINAEYN
ncbi:MAG: bifunctional glutamate N-acetyltransferase/amino-acid acetyltransferase ArgJ [Candidatus Omnitrophota bacterium]